MLVDRSFADWFGKEQCSGVCATGLYIVAVQTKDKNSDLDGGRDE